MSDKIYIVKESDDWDTWSISNHRTKKGAYKAIVGYHYEEWQLWRYIPYYNKRYFHITTEHLLD